MKAYLGQPSAQTVVETKGMVMRVLHKFKKKKSNKIPASNAQVPSFSLSCYLLSEHTASSGGILNSSCF